VIGPLHRARRRLGVLLGILALFAVSACGPVTAQTAAAAAPIAHGKDLGSAKVGPQAAGYASASLYPAATIKDDTALPYLRRIASPATYDGFTVAGPHLLIEGVAFSGPLDISARLPLVLRGVSIRIEGASYWGVLSRADAGPLHVLWSDVGSARATAGVGVQRGLYLMSAGSVVYRSRISRCVDGIQVHAPGVRVIETLVDDLATWPGEHNDGIQLIGRGDRVTVQRSRIANRHPQTSALLLQGGGHLIESNLLAGGGWTVYGGATRKGPSTPPARNIAFVGNIFAQDYQPRSGHFGPVADWDGSSGSGNVWRGNHFADGRPVEAATGKP
jgi:hypothetical protein